MEQFFIAPFAMDGSPQGIGIQRRSELSTRWLTVCAEFLAERPASFEEFWPAPLSHLKLKFTAARGAALATIYVGTNAAASLLLQRGSDAAAEKFLSEKFVSSLAALDAVKAFNVVEHPFSDVLSLKDRPLAVVVPWPDDDISDRDHALVRELATHLAASYLTVELQ